MDYIYKKYIPAVQMKKILLNLMKGEAVALDFLIKETTVAEIRPHCPFYREMGASFCNTLGIRDTAFL